MSHFARSVAGTGVSLLLALLMIAVLPGSPAAAATAVDLSVTVVGPSAAAPGGPFVYEVSIVNDGPTAADGSRFRNSQPAGATQVSASCTATAGAVCPAALRVSDRDVTATLPVLPPGGEVTIRVTGSFGPGEEAAGSVTDSVRVFAPTGVLDAHQASNFSSVSTMIRPQHYVADVYDSFTQDSHTISATHPVTYHARVHNNGPDAADGTTIAAGLSFGTTLFTAVDVTVLSCEGYGGVTCPAAVRGGRLSGGYYGYVALLYAVLPHLPSGGGLTIDYRIQPVETPAACGTRTDRFYAWFHASVPPHVTVPVDHDGWPDEDQGRADTPDVSPCPPGATPDVATTVTHTRAAFGTTGTPPYANTYTATVLNASDRAAEQVHLSLWASVYGIGGRLRAGATLLSCTATGGVRCPRLARTVVARAGHPLWAADVALPARGRLTLVYRLAVRFGPTACAESPPRVSMTASAYLGGVETDTDSTNNSSWIDTPVADLATCRSVDVRTSVQLPPFSYASPYTFTATVTNAGPEAADGVRIRLRAASSDSIYAAVRLHVVSCTARGGAACPTAIHDVQAPLGVLASRRLPTFPAGARLTLVYQLTPVRAAGASSCGLVGIDAGIEIGLPLGTSNRSPNSDERSAFGTCTDVMVNQSASTRTVAAGHPLSFLLRVSANAGWQHVALRDVLPHGFRFEGTACSTTTSSCQATYDPRSRTVTALVDVSESQEATVRITGHAGSGGRAYTNTARATFAADSYAAVDPRPASNSSTVSVSVRR